MPITKSAKKALRQSLRRRTRNLAKKRSINAAVKKYRRLLRAGNNQEAKQALSQVYKLLDKAVKTKVLKKNSASRLKSRLSKLLPSNK